MPGTRSLFRPILWRFIPVLATVVLAVLAFRNGVDVSGHGDIPDDTLFVQLYYAIGLFALGGMDLGMPVGGPVAWRRVLIVCYFAAPMMAAAAVIEALSRAIWSRLVALWPWRGHIVVAGGGRVARAVVAECRRRMPRASILVVEKTVRETQASHFRRMKRVLLISGDITDRQTAEMLRIPKARCVLLLSNDELANVELAVQYKDDFAGEGGRPILVRVADLDLVKRANRILARDDWQPCVNIHKAVAEQLCRDSIEHMKKLAGKETLVFSGFGRFARTYLREFIAVRGVEQISSIVLIDPEAELCWQRFFSSLPPESQVAVERIEVLRETGVQEDPRMWRPLLEDQAIGGAAKGKLVVLLGTNDDQSNLKAAMRMRDKNVDAYLMVRLFGASRFAKQVAKDMNLRLVDIERELEQQIQSWIGELEQRSRRGGG
jgi:hypothetical protein